MKVEAITYSESDFLNDYFVLQGMLIGGGWGEGDNIWR